MTRKIPYETNYNHYLITHLNIPTESLNKIIIDKKNKSLIGRVLSSFNPFVDRKSQVAAVLDLISAKENPHGETAQRINLKLEEYRKDKSSDVALGQHYTGLIEIYDCKVKGGEQ